MQSALECCHHGLLPRQLWVNTHDRVLRREFLIRHFDRAIPMEYCLKQVLGPEPREVLNVAEGLGKIPGNNQGIGEFLCVHVP